MQAVSGLRALLALLRGRGPAGPAAGGVVEDEAPFVALAEGLDALIARQGARRQARKALGDTLALAEALRAFLHRRGLPPAAGLLLEAMHESWAYVDTRTQQAFKECLRQVSAEARH